eukprot:1567224-Prymnesium_polylepis.1
MAFDGNAIGLASGDDTLRCDVDTTSTAPALCPSKDRLWLCLRFNSMVRGCAGFTARRQTTHPRAWPRGATASLRITSTCPMKPAALKAREVVELKHNHSAKACSAKSLGGRLA